MEVLLGEKAIYFIIIHTIYFRCVQQFENETDNDNTVTLSFLSWDNEANTTDLIDVKHYIDQYYDEPLSLQKLADQLHMDTYQLSKSFKSQFSFNLWTYVTKVRMEKAAELLTHTDLKIYQICKKIGMKEESHYSNGLKNTSV